MKKYLSIILILSITLLITGCKSQKEINNNSSTSNNSDSFQLESSLTDNNANVENSNSDETTSEESSQNIESNNDVSSPSSIISTPSQSNPSQDSDSGIPSFKPTLNYNFLPKDADRIYNSEAGGVTGNLELYKKMVNAYLNYETSVPFDSSTQTPHFVLNMLRFHCPVFFSDTSIDVDFADYSTGKVIITYTSKSKSEHNKIIEDFENACKPYISGLESASQTQKALICYYRYIQTLDYDYNLANFEVENFHLYDRNNPRYDEGYNALVKNTGVCSSFSIAYSFLLSQLNIDSYTIFAVGTDNAHAWNMLKLNGKWYFADPTFDADWPQGDNSITNFGITTKQRISLGYYPENYNISNLPNNFSDYSVNDLRFEALTKGAFNPEFNINNKTMIYKDLNEKNQPQFDLS